MEALDNINIYVEENVLLSDILFHESSLTKALRHLQKGCQLVNIFVVGTKNKKVIDEKIQARFVELLPDSPHTKNEVLVSDDAEQLYQWDMNYGKEILYLDKHMRGTQEYNKIYARSTTEDIMRLLKRYIHI